MELYAFVRLHAREGESEKLETRRRKFETGNSKLERETRLAEVGMTVSRP